MKSVNKSSLLTREEQLTVLRNRLEAMRQNLVAIEQQLAAGWTRWDNAADGQLLTERKTAITRVVPLYEKRIRDMETVR